MSNTSNHSVRVLEGQWNAAKRRAAARGESMSAAIRADLARYVADPQRHNGEGNAPEADRRYLAFRVIVLRVPADEWDAATNTAAEHGHTTAEVIRGAIARYTDHSLEAAS